ncbi:MAG: fibronectin type III domain-containing protein, partial [Methanophagales archaeon]|nr:fibronectin type III domain-containing protein [Methanophagales archaeon]
NYKIYRGTSSGAETLYYTTSTAGTTFNNCDNIVNGVTYYYKVKAVNAVGDSDFSNEVSATPPPEVAVSSPPRNLRVTEVGSGYVKIAWDTPSSDGGSSITNYKIYRGTSSGAETLYYTTSTAGTTFRNTANLVDGVTYYYKVTAVNSVGESDFSNEAYATYHPAGTITLTSPNGGEHWPIGRNRGIRWTSSDVTENVRIDLSRNGGSSWETIFSNTANDGSEWWTVTGTATTRARVRVVSLQNTAISAMSDANFKIFSITATVTSPSSGTNWPAGSTQTITWSMSGDTSNLDYFWVAYSMNGGQSWTNINTATASARSLNWAIPSDLSSTQCKIRVRALDADGWILTEGVSDVFTIHKTPSENTISFYTNPSSVGSITFSDTTYYTHGQSGKYSSGTYSISPNVPSGYKFKSWSTSGEVSVASSTSSSTTVTINGDCSLTANFESLPSTTVNGIDVSHWQGDIDWSQVYNSGYKFAFAKATGGTGFIDGDFEGNMIEGHNAGMLMGAYHFAYPEYNGPVDEAQFFVSVAGEYLREGYLRPVLDIEDDQNENSYPWRLGKEALSNWIHEFMSTVESETGVQPIIYVNKNYAKKDHLDTSINQYQLWIAHWTCDTNMPPDTGDTGIWNNWDFWQYWEPEYCGENSIPGITSGVDLDVFNGDMSRLNTFMIIVSNQPPTCAIELQKEGILINEVNVGHFFDIYVGDSTGDIKQVRFWSDDSQDGVPEGEWTEWYDWSISSEDWNAISKTEAWKFTTEGSKEVWAEVKDGDGQTGKCSANIVTENLYLLAKAIMSEASVGRHEERIAVGWTVLNRLDSNEFPSTIKKVVESGYAYNQEPTQDIIALSKDILERKYSDPTGGATYFFSPRSMTSGYRPYKIPGTNKKSHIPSWAIPKGYSKASPPPSDWEMTEFYKTIENLEWVSG